MISRDNKQYYKQYKKEINTALNRNWLQKILFSPSDEQISSYQANQAYTTYLNSLNQDTKNYFGRATDGTPSRAQVVAHARLDNSPEGRQFITKWEKAIQALPPKHDLRNVDTRSQQVKARRLKENSSTRVGRPPSEGGQNIWGGVVDTSFLILEDLNSRASNKDSDSEIKFEEVNTWQLDNPIQTALSHPTEAQPIIALLFEYEEDLLQLCEDLVEQQPNPKERAQALAQWIETIRDQPACKQLMDNPAIMTRLATELVTSKAETLFELGITPGITGSGEDQSVQGKFVDKVLDNAVKEASKKIPELNSDETKKNVIKRFFSKNNCLDIQGYSRWERIAQKAQDYEGPKLPKMN